MRGIRFATAMSVAAAAVGIAAGGNVSVAHADVCIPSGSFGCPVIPGVNTHVGPGDMIQTDDAACSVGMVGAIGNVNYAVTAGHCFEPGASVYDADNNPIGRYEAGVPDNDDNGDFGFALIRLDPGVTPSPTLTDGTTTVVGMNQNPRVGQQVCKLGSRTGESCGNIRAIAGPHIVVRGMNADHGDSGGVVYSPAGPGHAAFVGMIVRKFDETGDIDVESQADIARQLQGYSHNRFFYYHQ